MKKKTFGLGLAILLFAGTHPLIAVAADTSKPESMGVTLQKTSKTPTVALSASASTVAAGESVTLTWTSTKMKTCSAQGGWTGARPLSGSQTLVNVTQSQDYTITCTGKKGARSATVSVEVLPRPTVSLSVNAEEVREGSPVTLTWNSAHATSCAASGAWSGTKEPTGAEEVTVAAASTYNLECSGPGGSGRASVAVGIAAAPVVTLTASASTVPADSPVTLTWSARNAAACNASGAWSGSRTVSGNETIGVPRDSQFTLSCTGNGGVRQASVSVTTVPATTLTLASSTAEVLAGSSVTLRWSSDATSCSAWGNWGGNKAASGSEVVTVENNSNYALDCTGPGGRVTRSVVVKALTPEPFDQLQSRLTKIFTKDPFETTDTFLARAADELNQRKRYMARSTAATYNITSASYNADLEQLTFKFMFTCRSGDQGEPCAPSYAIPLAQGPRSGVTGSTSETLSILKLLNPPPEYTRGFVLRVPADVAKEIVQGSPYVVVQFRLSVDLTVDTSIAQKVVPVENITIRTMSGWRYNYTYPEVAAAALDSVSLVSRTSGKVLATYDVP